MNEQHDQASLEGATERCERSLVCVAKIVGDESCTGN
jgi:hypothetical protein